MTRLAILTPDHRDPVYGERWREVFARLARPLREAGAVVEPVAWTSGSVDGYDLVLPLLAWGYHFDPGLWITWVDAWDWNRAPVLNPPSVLRWNMDKRYLEELDRRGASVVPTLFVEAAAKDQLGEAAEIFQTRDLVVKPRVSAAAHHTVRARPQDSVDVTAEDGLMIQPFLPSVAEEGEQSLFFFDGVFSHAVTKVATGGDFRVQEQFGGRFSASRPTAEALETAQVVLNVVDERLLYARVDLARGLNGRLQLMELELIEPDLFLAYAPDGGAAFARAALAAASNT